MSHLNEGYRDAVQLHLQIVRKHHQEFVAEVKVYLPFAYTYGYTVPEIAHATGLSVPYVQRVLLRP
ncbi:hypothetical protein [uncultured Leifsonia sp.]|uniref:hypothetical protein n=1 Tax=uncultured Leifsonia sp. TaxID=340359 RepID=UPI0028D6286E|nr:hypothetical protein [uncultured Leifsonia sp.]